jgi:TonB-dependent starch-binding outer membrane protein SusC
MNFKIKSVITFIFVFAIQFCFSQKTITGKVSDNTGPLPGVNITVKGTTNKTSTDFDGTYSMKAKEGDILVFTFIGMRQVTRTVDAQNVYNMKMSEDTKDLEIVVIGYGKQTKKKLVQAVKVISNESIKDLVALSPQELLQGQAAGVQVVNSSGILGAGISVKIRGNASISAGGRPLYVVDGVPLNDLLLTSTQGGQSLNPILEINPNDIETLSVLKDASAAAIYGSRGSNGVVLITTKRGKKGQATKVTFDQNLSITNSTDLLPLMNGDQYRQFKTLRNNGGTDNPANFLPGSFDWLDAVDRTGYSRETNIGVSGGGEKTSFYLSFGRSDQQGFVIGNALQITNGRLSLDHEISNKLKVGANLSYAETKNDRAGSENSTFAPFTGAALIAP